MASGAALYTFSTKLPDEHLRTLEQEIQQHLLGRGKSDSWALLEDITTGIFREFGYQARVTAKSKDGGIDAVVDHPDFGNVCAQIKHTKNKVNVRVLRELIGTMCLNGVNTALLVTSSSFTRGVFKEQSLAAQRGFVVELVDGQRFLASLNLSHRMNPPTIAEVLAIADPTIEILRGEVNV